MNKAQLIDAMADETGMTKADCKRVVDAFIKTATEALARKERVIIVGFGSFNVVYRKPKDPNNPQNKTGSPGRNIVKFKPSKELSELLK